VATGGTDAVQDIRFARQLRRSTAGATPEELELYAAFQALIKVGWARPTSEFRRVFSSMMIPGGSEEQMRWLDDLQKMSVDAETAVLARSQRQVIDSSPRMAELDVPRPSADCSPAPDPLRGHASQAVRRSERRPPRLRRRSSDRA
jgi:hypothetical protein